MIVEALKRENGFFIPVNEELCGIQNDRIILEIRIVRQNEKTDEIDRFGMRTNCSVSANLSETLRIFKTLRV